MTTEAVLQTRDGAWRVEIVKRGQTHWYRIVHGDNTIDWLSIAAVERETPIWQWTSRWPSARKGPLCARSSPNLKIASTCSGSGRIMPGIGLMMSWKRSTVL